jgi:hypothetical protein
MLHCPQFRQHARAHTNLCVDIRQMKFNGFFSNTDFCGDRFVGPPGENEMEDFHFTRCEIRQGCHVYLLLDEGKDYSTDNDMAALI